MEVTPAVPAAVPPLPCRGCPRARAETGAFVTVRLSRTPAASSACPQLAGLRCSESPSHAACALGAHTVSRVPDSLAAFRDTGHLFPLFGPPARA
ncbi:hypothetical protein SUDANB120_03332 [Streptomyces sp. enrichment culture]